MERLEIIALLKKSKIFRGLSNDDLAFISENGRKRAFDGNDTIIREGQSGHSLFIVIKGKLEVVLPKDGNDLQMSRPTRIKLDRLSQGDCTGEYSLIDEQPASASVIAIEPCELFEISRAGFAKILSAGDHIARHIYENILILIIARARKRNKELDLCY